ncbi:Hsp20/alpha crystallin family protein [Thermomicrobium roseum]|uniref:Probable HspC2 heat shock protein n=1 Tax=Thermomicrobium roseum (strain ATCC 27502 / DSM 5159 / P-2) TaxID=309801 RepID=B9L1K2_THERP|nr:Hsp20/alpha crystallin family protein [Thermomicrobium roseum]ACM06268.1 probable HspC2 heat shock protein [Thermomicrobium roseum DSM 5159]
MAGRRSFDPWAEGFPWRELLEQAYGLRGERSGPMVAGVGVPVDIAELEDAYVIYAVIPGVEPAAMDLVVEDDRVVLRGEVREPSVDGQWVSRERRFGRFQRTIELPSPVDPERAEARYENGILVIRLPKAAPGRVRRIPVKAS